MTRTVTFKIMIKGVVTSWDVFWLGMDLLKIRGLLLHRLLKLWVHDERKTRQRTV